jgi:hypothetical protein
LAHGPQAGQHDDHLDDSDHEDSHSGLLRVETLQTIRV